MAVRQRQRPQRVALVRLNSVRVIQVFGCAVWLIGALLTGNLVNSLWPGMEAGKVLLMAAGGQVLLTIGQLRVVRSFYGLLPTFFFALDTISNAISLLHIFYALDFSSAGLAWASLVTMMTTGSALFNIVVLLLFVLVGYWIATTPERLIDTGPGGDE
jgi:hypothetical protein